MPKPEYPEKALGAGQELTSKFNPNTAGGRMQNLTQLPEFKFYITGQI